MFLRNSQIKLSILLKNVYRIDFCKYSSKEVNCKMRVLNVAEKNDAAKNIAGHLSGGNLQRVTLLLCFKVIDTFYYYFFIQFQREGFSKFNKIYEFNHTFRGSPSTMVMTSVSGHLLGYEFQGLYRSWNSCSPLELFDIPVVKECPKDFLNIKVWNILFIIKMFIFLYKVHGSN